MIAVVSWWRVADGALPPQASESDWRHVEGLLAKIWIEESSRGLWGAIMIWSDTAALERTKAVNMAEMLLGPPAERIVFDVPAACGLAVEAA